MALIILVVLQRLKCLMIPLKVLCTKSWHPLSLMGSPLSGRMSHFSSLASELLPHRLVKKSPL